MASLTIRNIRKNFGMVEVLKGVDLEANAGEVIALDRPPGYKGASDFATVALTGDQATATALLPQLTGSCAQCHKAYRIR